MASVLVAGPDAGEMVAREFRPASKKPFEETATNAIVFGRWGAEPAEEVVVTRRAADRVEIHCHGGVAASRAILSALESHGATILSWQDWIAREEPDPIRAAATLALADARTERTATILLEQYNGALRREIERIGALLNEAAVRNNLPLPLGEGRGEGFLATPDPSPQPSPTERGSRLVEALAALQNLLALAPLGLHLTRPWRVILAGPPNVGKSSLINALVGYERAIVFDQPGTTRDVVKAVTAFDGWPVELADTAGLRASRDELEAAGIERARQQLAAADGIVLVFDATQPFTAEDEQLVREYPQAILVRNKCDLLDNDKNPPAEPGAEQRYVFTSAVTGAGIADLQQQIVEHLVPVIPAHGAAVPFAAEQVRSLQFALDALQGDEAASSLAAIQAVLKCHTRSDERSG